MNETSPRSANCCKWDKCPGILPTFCITEDGFHPTCKKQMEAQKIETPHGVWKLHNIYQVAAMIGTDQNVIKAFKRQCL